MKATISLLEGMHITNKRNSSYRHLVPNPTHLDCPARLDPAKKNQTLHDRYQSSFVSSLHVATSSLSAQPPLSTPSVVLLLLLPSAQPAQGTIHIASPPYPVDPQRYFYNLGIGQRARHVPPTGDLVYIDGGLAVADVRIQYRIGCALDPRRVPSSS